MTAPTVAVTVILDAFSGTAVEGAIVHARLDKDEVYESIIVNAVSRETTDVNGQCVLNLFPNAPADADLPGLGTTGSVYEVTITHTGGRRIKVRALVPNFDCNLHEILIADDDSAAQAALLGAVRYNFAQSLSDPRKAQARTNIGAVDAVATATIATEIAAAAAAGAVHYDEAQSLDAGQKAQALANVGLSYLSGTPYAIAKAMGFAFSLGSAIYISPTGSDSTGNGSISLPYRNLYKALREFENLDPALVSLAIYVAPGDYTADLPSPGVFGASRANVLGSLSSLTLSVLPTDYGQPASAYKLPPLRICAGRAYFGQVDVPVVIAEGGSIILADCRYGSVQAYRGHATVVGGELYNHADFAAHTGWLNDIPNLWGRGGRGFLVGRAAFHAGLGGTVNLEGPITVSGTPDYTEGFLSVEQGHINCITTVTALSITGAATGRTCYANGGSILTDGKTIPGNAAASGIHAGNIDGSLYGATVV